MGSRHLRCGRGRTGGRIGSPWLLGACLFLAGCTHQLSVHGLKPLYPEVRGNLATNAIAYVEVDSLQPTLKWEPFPRPRDLEDPRLQDGRLARVTYDLRIWLAAEDRPTDLVYARDGLTEPAHRLESPLQPGTRYFWTVRAAFELNGQPRVIEWGVPRFGRDMRRTEVIPGPDAYGFATAAE
jgi:hypothetical protein